MEDRYLFIIENLLSDYEEYTKAFIIAKDTKEAMEIFKESYVYSNGIYDDTRFNDRGHCVPRYRMAVNMIQYLSMEDVLRDEGYRLSDEILVNAYRLSKSRLIYNEYAPG